VPDDIAVVGYDDITMASIVKPKLTTVAQPKYEMGQFACKALLKRLKTPDKQRECMTLKPKLIVRESSMVMKTSKS
jgi:DNA-binding LacI/PurR family transcriptional regulator